MEKSPRLEASYFVRVIVARSGWTYMAKFNDFKKYNSKKLFFTFISLWLDTAGFRQATFCDGSISCHRTLNIFLSVKHCHFATFFGQMFTFCSEVFSTLLSIAFRLNFISLSFNCSSLSSSESVLSFQITIYFFRGSFLNTLLLSDMLSLQTHELLSPLLALQTLISHARLSGMWDSSVI